MTKIEQVLNIKLNTKQKSYLPAVKWILTDGPKTKPFHGSKLEKHRQTGRTFLMLTVLVEKALKNRGIPVRIFDHFQTGSRLRYIMTQLENMLKNSKIPQSKIKIDKINYTLEILP